jgi:C-terminal processing protease CtpA/Prc
VKLSQGCAGFARKRESKYSYLSLNGWGESIINTQLFIFGAIRSMAGLLLPIGIGISSLLVGCGGGGGGGGSSVSDPATSNAGTSFAPSRSLANLCASPRPNTADRPGGIAQEKAYLRSFIDETYLWYRDIPSILVVADSATPQAYFDILKTSAKTSTGVAVDQFHWSQTTASWNAEQAGLAEDYGIRWAALANSPPRNWLVADVAPSSPAALAGIKRGDKVTSIDGVDFVNAPTEADALILNEGLFPTVLAAHRFGFYGKTELSMSPAQYSVTTVQNVEVLPTANGAVGFFTFDSQIAQSEAELIAAFNQLKAANVSDLVIDMRYNGGGFLFVASKLAYMVAGPGATTGKVFEQTIFNDKQSSRNTAYSFAFSGTTPISGLPHLDLTHVTLLVSRGTASASESVINSLRGIDVTVDLIGANTRGKPYGFFPQDNCGYTYFAIQFKGVNNKGVGDYADGFAPTCAIADDFNHARGDVAEGMLNAALSYRQTGVCPINASAQVLQAASRSGGGFGLVQPTMPALRVLTETPRP